MFAFPDLVNWYSLKQIKKIEERRFIWWFCIVCFSAGVLCSVIWIWSDYPDKESPFEVLISEDGLPSISLLISFLLVSIQEDSQIELQVELINNLITTPMENGKLCPKNIEKLAIRIIRQELIEEIKYPEIKTE